MTLINIYAKINNAKKGPKTTRTFVFKCDYCQQQFELVSANQKSKNEYHFCSVKCTNLAQLDGGVLKTKKQQTFIKKYGVDHPLKVDSIKNKVIEKSKESQIKKAKTTFEKYGVTHTFIDEGVKEKRRLTLVAKYGVEHPTKLKETIAKQHATKKKNGTYGKSKVEDLFYFYLCSVFKPENVKRQITIKSNWSIDFYIVSENLYIQFDGVYWHGLNRPIDEIKKFKTKQDVIIYQKWKTDQAQEIWFKEQGLNLLRITELDFKNKNYPDILIKNSELESLNNEIGLV